MTPTTPPRRPDGAGLLLHRPRKRFGQHFLASAWAQKVVKAIAPVPGDVFLEIGPGNGALTFPLAATGVPILAVEIDRDLAASLAERVPGHVTLLVGDFLTLDFGPVLSGLQPQVPPDAIGGARPQRRFRIAGNIPYSLSSPILLKLIEEHRGHARFADATLMLQREVADRLSAKPGTKAYGSLTVLIGVHASVVKVLDLPPGAFSPAPKVRSALVTLTFGPPSVRISDEPAFERLVKALFSQRRKTLTNAIKRFDPTGPAVLALAGIDGRRRPETLDLTEIARLAELFAQVRRPAVV